MVGRVLNVRSRTLPADDAAHGAHQTAKYPILDQVSHDGTSGRGAGGDDTDLDFNEGPYTCCGNTDWKKLAMFLSLSI